MNGIVTFHLVSFCLLSFRLLRANLCHFAYFTNNLKKILTNYRRKVSLGT